ncbi:MAG TPA: excisionase [Lachnospiraceae bacterium]|nr:excisionase [Lachnospiraceae bacterium]
MLEQYQDILSVFDVAEVLFIGKNRVYELLEKKELKGFRIGRVWKIPRDALLEYILRQSNLK